MLQTCKYKRTFNFSLGRLLKKFTWKNLWFFFLKVKVEEKILSIFKKIIWVNIFVFDINVILTLETVKLVDKSKFKWKFCENTCSIIYITFTWNFKIIEWLDYCLPPVVKNNLPSNSKQYLLHTGSNCMFTVQILSETADCYMPQGFKVQCSKIYLKTPLIIVLVNYLFLKCCTTLCLSRCWYHHLSASTIPLML